MGTSEVRHLGRKESLSGIRLFPIVGYFATIVVAESIATFWRPPSGEGILLGMILHVGLLFTLLLHASILADVDPSLSQFLAAFSLAPLIRVLSLALPGLGTEVPQIGMQIARLQWFLLMTIALVGAAAALGMILRIPPREVGLGTGARRLVPWQVPIALSGLGLGAMEFLILNPSFAVDPPTPWIPALSVQNLLLAAVAVGLASGFAEELIFRGFILNRSERLLGATPALLLVSLLFAAMHIGFVVTPAGEFDPVRAFDVPFVFLVGLYFGFVVQKTRTIWGVIIAHGLANVMLYLVLPLALPL